MHLLGFRITPVATTREFVYFDGVLVHLSIDQSPHFDNDRTRSAYLYTVAFLTM